MFDGADGLSDENKCAIHNSWSVNTAWTYDWSTYCAYSYQVWHVATTGSDDNDGSEGSPFATIQHGINAASDGDTVLVAVGTYVENINYNSKQLVVASHFISSDGDDDFISNTIIDGDSTASCVKMSGAGSKLIGFTLTNGYAFSYEYGGSAITIDDPCEISYCLITKNYSYFFGDGATIFIFGSSNSSTFDHLTIYDNHSGGYGDVAVAEPNSSDIFNFYNNINAVLNYYGGYQPTTNYINNYNGDNPMFCDPDNEDYSLAANSPLVGAGENETDIGALGVGCNAFDLSLTINEIMNNPSAVSDSDGEWFEIFNNGDVSHDLYGWTIKDNGNDSHEISSSLVINPGEYLVLGNNEWIPNGGTPVNYQYDNITLANSDDEIVLINQNGIVIDSVSYDGGATFPDPNGASMALVHPDSNNTVGTNWQESTTAYGDGDLGTPGLPNFSSDIDVELTTIDFDTVLVGESFEQILSIYNMGNTTLLIDSVYTSSDLFTLPFTENSIDDSLELIITFMPSEYGVVEDTLFIMTNDPDEGHLEIPLIAFGYIPSPNIVLESTSIDFGTVMDGLTETIELHVANDGDVALSLSSVYIEGSTNFTIPNFSTSVAENDTGLIEIKFSPDDETSFSGTLYIVSNDPDTDTLMVSLNGSGGEQAPIMVLSDDELYFGTVEAGTTVEREVIIYNKGMLDLEIQEITISDSDYYTTTFSDASVEPGDSVVVPFSFAPTEQVAEIIATATVSSNVGAQTVELQSGYFGPVWHVATTGSDETGDGTEQNPFSTIQYAIGGYSQNAENGDTVLVHPGIYTEDNIAYNGKNIIVSSLFITTQDTSYIASTIIDGSANTVSILGVVNFLGGEDSTAVLTGFTIKNGNHGIVCGHDDIHWAINSSPTIKNVIISDNISDDTGAGVVLFESSNPTFIDVIITNNFSDQFGGGVFCQGSNAIFINTVISENSSNGEAGGVYINAEGAKPKFYNSSIIDNFSGGSGGGIYIENGDIIFSDGEIIGNESEQDGGAIMISHDSLIDSSIISNTTISYNKSSFGGNITIEGYGVVSFQTVIISDNVLQGSDGSSGITSSGEGELSLENVSIVNNYSSDCNNNNDECVGSLLFQSSDDFTSYLSIINSIFWNHNDNEFFISSGQAEQIVDISHSNIQGGYEGQQIIDADPMFCSQENRDFSLGQNSPCLGSGLNGSNIGALGVGCDEGQDWENEFLLLDKNVMPVQYTLHQNYPNPFNPVTSLRYDLPEDGLVNITVYDMMGRVVKTLVNTSQTAGYKSIRWNATNDRNESVSAGLYLYTIQAGEFRQTKKMVLLK